MLKYIKSFIGKNSAFIKWSVVKINNLFWATKYMLSFSQKFTLLVHLCELK